MAEQRLPSILFDLYVAYQKTGLLLALALEGTGISADDFALYNRLAHVGSATATELAESLGMARSTFIFRFNRLVERGHATRIPNPRDGRSSLLTLTPEGQRAADRALPPFRDLVASVLRELTIPSARVGVALSDLAAATDKALEAAREQELLNRGRR